MSGISFKKEERKAFYTVGNQLTKTYIIPLGHCFKMHYKPDKPTELPEERRREKYMWVSAQSVFEKNDYASLIACRCKKSGKEERQQQVLQMSLKSTNNGISFINCEEDKNCLLFGLWDKIQPKEVYAFVHVEKDIFHGIKFIRNTSGRFVLADDTSSSSKSIDLSKAVGSPIIEACHEPDSNRVVGILCGTSDGRLYPELFSRQTFEQEIPSTKVPSQGDFEAGTSGIGQNPNGDAIDSSEKVCGVQEKDKNSGPAKPDLKPRQFSQAVQTTNGNLDGVSSSQRVQNIWDKNLQEIPRVYNLFKKLHMVLNPERPLLENWKMLAGEFGYSYQQILLLDSNKADRPPTVEILTNEMSRCTLTELDKKLEAIGRDDAREEIVKFVNNLNNQ